MADGPTADENDSRLADLDDAADRDELRRRYYGLLQELRVVIPGVQVLLAFLLTAPFAPRFADLDTSERRAYGIALCSSLMSVVCLLTPTVLHRVGERTARKARLRLGIWLTLVGLGALAVALLSALWCVGHLVYSPSMGTVLVVGAAGLLAALWLVLPLSMRHVERIEGDDGPAA